MRFSLVLLFVVLLFSFCGAGNITLHQLQKMPRSIEKDYYIWRFLRQRSTKRDEAQKVVSQIKHINDKLQKAYLKKTGRRLHKKRSHIASGLSPAKKKRLKIKKAVTRDVVSCSNPLERWHKLSCAMKIFVFDNAGREGRRRLDHTPSRREWLELTMQRGIDTFIRKIRKERLPKLSSALLYLPARGNKISFGLEFELALGAISKGKRAVAAAFFNDSIKKAKSREEADKALFWSWLTSHKKSYLQRLGRSYEVNIYTLYARDMLGRDYPSVIVPKLPKKGKRSDELYDPIAWARLKKKIFSDAGGKEFEKLASRYAYGEGVGYYSYILAKESRDKKQFFPIPYRDLLSRLSIERQAMLYAIARQESRFIPAAVSSSFAIGMMQLMPFLIEHIAKQRGERRDYDELFDPKVALVYANQHLNYLHKWLQHPLFVAYAYNAGIGYTKRMLKRGRLFSGNGRYEPWLSLERLSNEQAREYGKKVLSNYVIYMNLLGKSTRMKDQLSNLHLPHQTDRFRKR